MGYAKHSAGGNELIVNGGVPSNASGWTLGQGWAWLAGALKFTGPGTEKTTNGTFTGNASGWTLGAALAYGTNNVVHTTGIGSNYDADNRMTQAITAVLDTYYVVTLTLSGFCGVRVAMGDPDSSGLFIDNPALQTNTYKMVMRAAGNDGNLYISWAQGGVNGASIDNVSVKAVPLVQTISGSFDYYRASLNVGGTIGSVDVFFANASVKIGTIAAGAGVTALEGTTDGTYGADTFGLYIVPTDNFNGDIDDISMKLAYVTPLEQFFTPTQWDDDAVDYTVRVKVGGTQGSVVVALTDGDTQHDEQTVAAGAGNVTLTLAPPLSLTAAIGITITPTSDFNGTIDDVSVKLASGGSELVTNGGFNGPTGWVDKKDAMPNGWSYHGGSGNTGTLPTYTTSLLSAIARVKQGIARPEFVVGGQDSDGNYALFKKSTTYTFAMFRSRVFRYNYRFGVEKIWFNIHAPLAEGMILVPVLCMDGNTIRVQGTEISTDKYDEGDMDFQFGPANFGYRVRGKSDWFLELQSQGEVLCCPKLPIFADVELDNENM